MVKVVAADSKNQKNSQRLIKRIKKQKKMVEAMFERTPECFRQFQKLFRYFVCNSEPQFDSNLTKNFAYSQHKNEDHCKIQHIHCHVIASVDQLPQSFKDTSSKPYTTPCLLTCFQLLIRGSSHIVHYGEVIEKLQEAASYNDQYNLAVSNSKKKLPNVNTIMTQDVQTQTDFLPLCTIDRFYSIYNAGMYGELSKILDIINSGYGCLHVDNSLILIDFNMESKSFN